VNAWWCSTVRSRATVMTVPAITVGDGPRRKSTGAVGVPRKIAASQLRSRPLIGHEFSDPMTRNPLDPEGQRRIPPGIGGSMS
jgi:hypothetical protein